MNNPLLVIIIYVLVVLALAIGVAMAGLNPAITVIFAVVIGPLILRGMLGKKKINK